MVEASDQGIGTGICDEINPHQRTKCDNDRRSLHPALHLIELTGCAGIRRHIRDGGTNLLIVRRNERLELAQVIRMVQLRHTTHPHTQQRQEELR